MEEHVKATVRQIVENIYVRAFERVTGTRMHPEARKALLESASKDMDADVFVLTETARHLAAQVPSPDYRAEEKPLALDSEDLE